MTLKPSSEQLILNKLDDVYEPAALEKALETALEATLDEAEAMHGLPPLAHTIVDKAIDNMTRKLIGGLRNKKVAVTNSKSTHWAAESKEALKAVSAQSVMDVANRGQLWKEMITKTITRGVGSLSTMQFDGEFQIRNGQRPADFKKQMPDKPGVYVVFSNETGKPVYVGDSGDMQSRWNAGHFNEYQQGEKSGDRYKLAKNMEAGCTVKFLVMDSVESAAALEAHLIRENFDKFQDVSKTDLAPGERNAEKKQQERDEALEGGMLLNKKEELKTEQGTRSNAEAKKVKDSSGSVAGLAKGAAVEGMKNVGYDIAERLVTTCIKGVKDEMVDVFMGGKSKLQVRVSRLFKKVLAVLESIIDQPMQILRGLAEFVVNALSKAASQIYNLVRNLFDLGMAAVQLYRGSETMSREELVRKISEAVIISGSLVIWDALDPVLEVKLLPLCGPFAPYLASALVAIGFGVTSYGLQKVVTCIIDAVVGYQRGLSESLEASREACNRMLELAEKELSMLSEVEEYVAASTELMRDMAKHTAQLSQHKRIEPLDIETMRLRLRRNPVQG